MTFYSLSDQDSSPGDYVSFQFEAFRGIPESENDYLRLFPHRFDFIRAPHPRQGSALKWETVDSHPLEDRHILESRYLYGVRFGTFTRYVMLDIDRGSRYHPYNHAFALSRVLAAIEPLGLVDYVPITSSDSNGIHLYFPFPFPVPSHEIARAIEYLLNREGIQLEPGQLELFPHPKRLPTALFTAHRLPLQSGSYLLNKDWQPMLTSREFFVQQWGLVASRNELNFGQIALYLEQSKHRVFNLLRGKAKKFYQDLCDEIEQGWTGPGQTNRILGRLAMRTYIFQHVITGGEPLRGQDLVQAIVNLALELPGVQEFCSHIKELGRLAFYWSRAIESSHYYPYRGRSPSNMERKPNQFNLNQSYEARERIRLAVEELIQDGEFPVLASHRSKLLRARGISNDTLYKHKDLWYPGILEPLQDMAIQSIPATVDQSERLEPLQDMAIQPVEDNKLICDLEGGPPNPPPNSNSDQAVGGSGGFSTADGLRVNTLIPGWFLDKIRARVSGQRSAPPPDEVPPDEELFKRLAGDIEHERS